MVEPQSFVSFQPIYKTEYPGNDHIEDRYINFDLQLIYKLVHAEGEVYHGMRRSRCSLQTIRIAKEWFICGDSNQFLDKIHHFLDVIHIPRYRDIVETLYYHILHLTKREADFVSPKVERVQVMIQVAVSSFPHDVIYMDMGMGMGMDMYIDVDVDVKPVVPPASDEAMENHLETVIVENAEECAICLETFQPGSDVAAVQLPCTHVFHRTCGEKWLRTSGICPVCRAMFPS